MRPATEMPLRRRAKPRRATQPRTLPTDVASWLIDGFNVLHAGFFEARQRSQWWTAEHRNRLIERIEEFPLPAAELWLIFDGRDNPRDGNHSAARKTRAGSTLQAVFAASADDWIIRRVRESNDPRSIAVVSGDRAVGGRARHHGAQVVSPRVFLGHCGPRSSQPNATPDAAV